VSARRAGGFTLLELLVSVAVTLVVIGGIVTTVNAQQRAYATGHRERASQGSGRAALLQLEQTAQLAGFGMDAPLALDMDRYAGPCPPELGACPRDAVDRPDELVFYNRRPRYWVPDDYGAEPVGAAWRIVSVAANAVRIVAHGGEVFPRGQVLQAVCPGATRYTYFTVSTTTPAAAAGAEVDVPLVAVDGSEPFRRQDYATGCFNSGRARLFLIDRHRYHVRPVLVGPNRYDPYLMLDMGVDLSGDGAVDELDEIVVAEGIELMQVAYVMANPALAPRGLTPGVAIALARGEPGAQSATAMTTLLFPGNVDPGFANPEGSPYAWSSWFRWSVGPPAHARRLDDHQANVVALRIALSARPATQPTSQRPGLARGPLFNANAFQAWMGANDAWERVTFETTIPLRNMAVRVATDY
jgi:type IV pilus assembly protein PilW